jgi:hypothetical protein
MAPVAAAFAGSASVIVDVATAPSDFQPAPCLNQTQDVIVPEHVAVIEMLPPVLASDPPAGVVAVNEQPVGAPEALAHVSVMADVLPPKVHEVGHVTPLIVNV